MATICRLCATLKKTNCFIHLRKDTNLNLCYKLEKCCQLYIDDNDLLPDNACTDCIQCLDECWKFFKKVQNAQVTLKKLFEKNGETSSIHLGEIHKNEIVITTTKSDDYVDELSSNLSFQLLHHEENADAELVDEFHDRIVCNDDEEIKDEIINETDEEQGSFYMTVMHSEDEDASVNQGISLKKSLKETGGIDGNIIIKEYVEDVHELSENKDDDADDDDNDNYNEIVAYLTNDNDNCPVNINKTWNDYQWKCNKCNLLTKTALDLQNHVNKTHGNKTVINYLCVDCLKTFPKYYSFINHVRFRHRNYLQLCCDICVEFFETTEELANHRATEHENDKNCVLCPTCGKGFKNTTALQVHSNCHKPYEDKYKFACELCTRRFASKPNLKAHQKIHTGLKEFVCDQCGKGFVQKANLEEHLLTHTNDCPYECKECKKKFKTPERLTKHKIIHTDVKPHKCHICGRQFREKDSLKVHGRIHTGAMPFECEFCGKKFRFKSILTTHRHQHTGARPYSCIECDHHFTNWPNYNKHMKRRHGIDTTSSARKTQRMKALAKKTVNEES